MVDYKCPARTWCIRTFEFEDGMAEIAKSAAIGHLVWTGLYAVAYGGVAALSGAPVLAGALVTESARACSY